MNIFHKIALQGLRKNRARTLVTVVGVALSTALFTAIAAFGTSLIAYMVNSEIAKGGDWHIMFSGATPSQRPEWQEDAEVSDITEYENIGYAQIPGAEEKNTDKPYLFIAGFSEETFDSLPVRLTSGRRPENSSEVLVPSDSIAIKAGVRILIKDTLTLAVGERESDGKILTQCDPYTENETLNNTKEQTYTVVGTFEKPGFEVEGSPGYTIITKTDENTPAENYSLYIALKNPRKVREYAGDKAEEITYGINENLLRFMGVSDNKIFNAFIYSIGGVLVLIIMTGSVLLIYNAFHISLNERVHQYGILMSVGATARQLCGAVLFEGICIGCIGIPIGMLAGIGVIIPILPAVSKAFAVAAEQQETLTLAVSFPALLSSALISMITILISAYIPARKAARIPVMDCIRQTGEIKTEAKTVKVSKLTWKLYGLEGTLALKNFKRNKKRYRSIVLSLTLSVILTVAGSAFGTSLKKAAGAYTTQQADGDVSFITQDMEEEEFTGFYEKLKELEDIEKSTWQADYMYTAVTEELPEDFLAEYREAEGESGTGSKQQVVLVTQFIEDDIFIKFVEEQGLPVEEYTGADAKIFMCLMNGKTHTTYFAGDSMHFTIISPKESEAAGSTLHKPFSDSTKEICVTFADTYPLDDTIEFEKDVIYVFIVTAPLSIKPQFKGLETVDGCEHFGALFWTGMPTQTVGRIQTMLVEEGIMADYRLYNLSQAFELFRRTDFVIDLFIYVFTAMISLIAVANVFNTISTNIRLRRRELAMLRSTGMSDKGFNRMMRFECAFYGMWTLLFGIPVSAGLSYLIHKAITSAEKMEDMAFTFPWGAMGVSILGVFLIVFITMVYAVRKIRKENIIDALRDETA